MKDAKIIFVAGGRGQGKSTHVKARMRDYARIIVFDPQREYHKEPGFTPAETLAQVHELMIAGHGKTYKIAYVPPADYPLALHELSVFLEAAQQPYADDRSQQKILLVVEEMNLSAPSSQLPLNMQGFTRMCAQGRHFGIEIMGVTQRPKMVMPNFRSQAAEEIYFKLGSQDDLADIDRKLPPDWKGKIFALQPHEYLKIGNGTVIKGKNQLSSL